MSEISPTEPQKWPPHSSPLQAAKKLPWANIALVTASIALVIIASLGQAGILHLGTPILSSQNMMYVLYGGAGIFALIEIGKLIYDAKHPTASISSDDLIKPTFAIIHKSHIGKQPSATPNQYTFEINHKTYTLYGMYPKGMDIEKKEGEIESFLRSQSKNTLENTEQLLKKLSLDIDIVLKVGNEWVVSGENILYLRQLVEIDPDVLVDLPHPEEQRWQTVIHEIEGVQLLILASAETKKAIDRAELKKLAGEIYTLGDYVQKLQSHIESKNPKETSMIVLNLESKPIPPIGGHRQGS